MTSQTSLEKLWKEDLELAEALRRAEQVNRDHRRARIPHLFAQFVHDLLGM